MSNQRPPGAGEPLRPKRKKRKRRWIGYTLLVLLGIFLGAAGYAGSYVYKAYQALPAFEDLDPNVTSFIYDRKDREVYKLAAEENRTLIKDLSEIPEDVLWAFIDTEDHRFKEHKGVDFYRMGGAVWSTAKYLVGIEGSQLEGGSTITMQLAGNAFLDRRNITPYRKVQEMLLAFQLEKKFTKDEILLRYLNQVSFGGTTAGLEEAARTYFSKSAKDLTLSEAAMLAGMLKAPSFYNPMVNKEGAMNRRAVVLTLMAEYGHLTPDEAAALKAEDVVLNPATVTPQSRTFTGDWYVDYVIQILTEPDVAAKYGTPTFDPNDLYTRGLKIYTALDLDYQKVTEEKLQTIIPERTKYYGGKDIPEGAAVVMEPKDGYVRAIVGGLKHEHMLGYNRATQAYRQPGSAIKPLVDYLPAIDLLGWGPATVIDDSPPMLSFPDQDNVWPENYDFYYNGLISMRGALEKSLNAVAVRTLMAVTPRKGLEYGRNLGLSTLVDASMDPKDNDENLSLALGGIKVGVTALDMATAYSSLANLGVKPEPIVITRIENKDGELIFEATPKKKPVVKNKDSVWLMVDIMKGSITRGTAAYEAKAWHGWPAAGKTGTTENWQDAWFGGFTTELTTVVWTGYDNNEGEQKRLPANGNGSWTGAGPPTRIWTAIMDELVKQAPPDWQRPNNVVRAEVCKVSGLVPSPLCPPDQVVSDWWRQGFVPKKVDDVLTMAKVVRQPFLDPKTKEPIINPKTKQPVERYYLWQEGCQGTPEELLLINRPSTYVLHPKNPYNFDKYWPLDWWKEVPKDTCTPVAPQPGTNPPGTNPPGTNPPGTNPPGTTPPDNGTNPPITLPPILPPGPGH